MLPAHLSIESSCLFSRPVSTHKHTDTHMCAVSNNQRSCYISSPHINMNFRILLEPHGSHTAQNGNETVTRWIETVNNMWHLHHRCARNLHVSLLTAVRMWARARDTKASATVLHILLWHHHYGAVWCTDYLMCSHSQSRHDEATTTVARIEQKTK